MPDLLTRAKQYRDKAGECQRQAVISGIEPHVRDHYRHLAEVYVGLAEAAEKLAAKRLRPVDE